MSRICLLDMSWYMRQLNETGAAFPAACDTFWSKQHGVVSYQPDLRSGELKGLHRMRNDKFEIVWLAPEDLFQTTKDEKEKYWEKTRPISKEF